MKHSDVCALFPLPRWLLFQAGRGAGARPSGTGSRGRVSQGVLPVSSFHVPICHAGLPASRPASLLLFQSWHFLCTPPTLSSHLPTAPSSQAFMQTTLGHALLPRGCVTNCPKTEPLKANIAASVGQEPSWSSAGGIWLRTSQGCKQAGIWAAAVSRPEPG